MSYTLFITKESNVVIHGCIDCPFFKRNQMFNSFCKLNYIEFKGRIYEDKIPKTIPENCKLYKNDIKITSVQRFVNKHPGWEDWKMPNE